MEGSTHFPDSQYYGPRYMLSAAMDNRSMRSHQFHYLHGRSRMQFQQYHHAYGHPYFFYLPNSFTSKKPKRYAIPSQGKPSGLSINNYNYLRARFARQTINSHGEERNRSDNPPPLIEKPEDVPATGREETANERGLREADRRMTTERTVSCLNYSNQKIGHERKSVINETIKKKTTFEVESERLFSQCVDEAGHEMRHKKRQLSVSRPTIIVRGREPPSEKTDPTSSNSASSWAHGKRFELQNIEEGKREEDKERRKREQQDYKCQYCAKKFPKASALLVHQRVHTGEKPFLCPQCGKAFSILGNLRRHMFIHTGERPFACRTCGKTFNNPSHVRRHERRLHPSIVESTQ